MKSHLIERFGTWASNDRKALVLGPRSTHHLRYSRIAAIFVAIDREQGILP